MMECIAAGVGVHAALHVVEWVFLILFGFSVHHLIHRCGHFKSVRWLRAQAGRVQCLFLGHEFINWYRVPPMSIGTRVGRFRRRRWHYGDKWSCCQRCPHVGGEMVNPFKDEDFSLGFMPPPKRASRPRWHLRFMCGCGVYNQNLDDWVCHFQARNFWRAVLILLRTRPVIERH